MINKFINEAVVYLMTARMKMLDVRFRIMPARTVYSLDFTPPKLVVKPKFVALISRQRVNRIAAMVCCVSIQAYTQLKLAPTYTVLLVSNHTYIICRKLFFNVAARTALIIIQKTFEV